MKVRTEKIVTVQEWDRLVKETYGRRYRFQQQDDCKYRGIFWLTVPDEADDFGDDRTPAVLAGEEMGVSFAAWLSRDPSEPRPNDDSGWMLGLWWDRHFYPDVQMVANDLHAKGLLEAGSYGIEIDW